MREPDVADLIDGLPREDPNGALSCSSLLNGALEARLQVGVDHAFVLAGKKGAGVRGGVGLAGGLNSALLGRDRLQARQSDTLDGNLLVAICKTAIDRHDDEQRHSRSCGKIGTRKQQAAQPTDLQPRLDHRDALSIWSCFLIEAWMAKRSLFSV